MSGYQDDVFFRIALLEHPGNRSAMQSMFSNVQEMVTNMTGIVTKVGDAARGQLSDINSSLQKAQQQYEQFNQKAGSSKPAGDGGAGGGSGGLANTTAIVDGLNRVVESMNKQHEVTRKLIESSIELSNKRAEGYRKEAEALQRVVDVGKAVSNSGTGSGFVPGSKPFASNEQAGQSLDRLYDMHTRGRFTDIESKPNTVALEIARVIKEKTGTSVSKEDLRDILNDVRSGKADPKFMVDYYTNGVSAPNVASTPGQYKNRMASGGANAYEGIGNLDGNFADLKNWVDKKISEFKSEAVSNAYGPDKVREMGEALQRELAEEAQAFALMAQKSDVSLGQVVDFANTVGKTIQDLSGEIGYINKSIRLSKLPRNPDGPVYLSEYATADNKPDLPAAPAPSPYADLDRVTELEDQLQIQAKVNQEEKEEHDRWMAAAEEKKRKQEELNRLHEESMRHDWNLGLGGGAGGGSGDGGPQGPTRNDRGVELASQLLEESQEVVRLQEAYDNLAERSEDANRAVVRSGAQVLGSIGRIAEGIAFLGLSNKKQTDQWIQDWVRWYTEIKGGFAVFQGMVQGFSDVWKFVDNASKAVKDYAEKHRASAELQQRTNQITEGYNELLSIQSEAEAAAAQTTEEHARSQSHLANETMRANDALREQSTIGGGVGGRGNVSGRSRGGVSGSGQAAGGDDFWDSPELEQAQRNARRDMLERGQRRAEQRGRTMSQEYSRMGYTDPQEIAMKRFYAREDAIRESKDPAYQAQINQWTRRDVIEGGREARRRTKAGEDLGEYEEFSTAEGRKNAYGRIRNERMQHSRAANVAESMSELDEMERQNVEVMRQARGGGRMGRVGRGLRSFGRMIGGRDIAGAVAGDMAGDAIYAATGSDTLSMVGDMGVDAAAQNVTARGLRGFAGRVGGMFGMRGAGAAAGAAGSAIAGAAGAGAAGTAATGAVAAGGGGIAGTIGGVAGGIGTTVAGGIGAIAALPGAAVGAALAAIGSLAVVAVEVTEAFRGTSKEANSLTNTIGKYSGANKVGEKSAQWFGTSFGYVDNALGLDSPFAGLYRSDQAVKKMQKGRIKYETLGIQNEQNEANALAGNAADYQRQDLRRDVSDQRVDFNAQYARNQVDIRTQSNQLAIGNRMIGARRDAMLTEAVYGRDSIQTQQQERRVQELGLQQRQAGNYGQLEKATVDVNALDTKRTSLQSEINKLAKEEAELKKSQVDKTAEVEQNLQRQAQIATELQRIDTQRIQAIGQQKEAYKSIADAQREFAADRIQQLQREEAAMVKDNDNRARGFTQLSKEDQARVIDAKKKLDSGSTDPQRRAALEREVEAAAQEVDQAQQEYDSDSSAAREPGGKGRNRISSAKRKELALEATRSGNRLEGAQQRLNMLRDQLGGAQGLSPEQRRLLEQYGGSDVQQKLTAQDRSNPAYQRYQQVFGGNDAKKLEANRTEQKQLALQLQNQVTVKLDEQFNEQFFRGIVTQNILPEMEKRLQAGFTQITRNLTNQQAANAQQANTKLQQAKNQTPSTK